MSLNYVFVLLLVGCVSEIRGNSVTCDKTGENICEIPAYDPDLPIVTNGLLAEDVIEVRLNGSVNGAVKLTSNVCNAFPNLLVFKALGIGLKEVAADAFTNCSKLTAIYLDDNELSSLDNAIFQANHELERIELPNNTLKTFDTSILNHAPKLRLLFLSDNGMDEFVISDESVQLTKLVKIELMNNKLKSVDLREIKEKFPNILVLVFCDQDIDWRNIAAAVPEQRFLSINYDCNE